MYFPTKLSMMSAEATASQMGFVAWKNGEGRLMGWHLPARDPKAAVLIVHGNAGCALNRQYLAEPIHRIGNIDVYILEYPGYGPREGQPELNSITNALDAAFSAMPTNVPRYVVSESIGTGPAASLANSRGNEIAGFAMFVPYDDMLSLAKAKMRLLPVGLILKDRYQPSKWLENYRGPIQFVVAEKDEVIPAGFGLKLHEQYGGPKRLQVVAGAHHNDVAEQDENWWKEVFAFWTENRTSAR
jgi:pimeloyl-ACP methyl ester carboxylesterase